MTVGNVGIDDSVLEKYNCEKGMLIGPKRHLLPSQIGSYLFGPAGRFYQIKSLVALPSRRFESCRFLQFPNFSAREPTGWWE